MFEMLIACAMYHLVCLQIRLLVQAQPLLRHAAGRLLQDVRRDDEPHQGGAGAPSGGRGEVTPLDGALDQPGARETQAHRRLPQES